METWQPSIYNVIVEKDMTFDEIKELFEALTNSKKLDYNYGDTVIIHLGEKRFCIINTSIQNTPISMAHFVKIQLLRLDTV